MKQNLHYYDVKCNSGNGNNNKKDLSRMVKMCFSTHRA